MRDTKTYVRYMLYEYNRIPYEAVIVAKLVNKYRVIYRIQRLIALFTKPATLRYPRRII
jgi:hypothetical protein